MSESGFREIQLSGKHVVFLFMAGAVAAIAIFLLGVSVGRGVVKPEAGAEPAVTPAAPIADSGAPPVVPPPTTPAKGELQYHETLQGKAEASSAAAMPSPSATPAGQPPPAKPASTPEPSASPASKPAALSLPPAQDAVWYVTVDAFSSRDNASRRVAQLKAKGIGATILDTSGSGARFKVRVGPMDRKAAEAMVQRLRKEGFKPSAPTR